MITLICGIVTFIIGNIFYYFEDIAVKIISNKFGKGLFETSFTEIIFISLYVIMEFLYVFVSVLIVAKGISEIL